MRRLVARAQGGEREAIERLCVLHSQRIEAWARRLLRNPEDARDATQHVLMRMIEALPSYRQTDAPFRAWLFAIARNYAIDVTRRRQRTRPEPDPQADGVASPSGSLAAFDQLVGGLTASQRRVLFLRYACGLPTGDIAELLEASDSSVRHIQRRALAALRERMTPFDADAPTRPDTPLAGGSTL